MVLSNFIFSLGDLDEVAAEHISAPALLLLRSFTALIKVLDAKDIVGFDNGTSTGWLAGIALAAC